MFLTTFAPGEVCRGQVWPAEFSVLNVHPTVSEFREEMLRADVVVRARIVEILRRREGVHADLDAVVEIVRVYKGKIVEDKPCVRMEIFQSHELDGRRKLAEVGDEVILPIEIVQPYTGTPPPNGQKVHYAVPFYYSIGKDGTVGSAFGFPRDMQRYTQIDRLEELITSAVNRPRLEPPRFELGEVLFRDDFDDGSMAGWTFLEGERNLKEPPPAGVGFDFEMLWIGPHSTLKNDRGFAGEPPTTTLTRDPETGLYTARHNNTVIEIGATAGRLRLRSSHALRHLTVVTGDPEWTDYQIDVDVYNMVDVEQPHARANYLKFGPYGRVHVPNFPQTQGEHSFVAVEIGNFANYDVSLGTWDNSAYQIRCKYAEPKLVYRDQSRLLRLTKILDYPYRCIKSTFMSMAEEP